jgi:hypothetical protein
MIKNYKLKTSIAFALVCFLMSFVSVNAQITAYSRTVLTGLTYTDMTLATAGPTGDDAAVNLTLPFTFTYDGVGYTTLRVCTNGWVAFAGGTSTSFTAGNLFVNTAPNATIAGWWGDGNSNAANAGLITAAIHPTLPNVYVVQYKEVSGSASGAASATNKISYQVHLYGPTSSNPGRIEILYGPSLGTISTGRSIGIENVTGGTNNYINALNGLSNSTATSTAWVGNGNGYRFDPPVPCAGTPNAGTTAGPVGACPTVNFGLNLTGATIGVTGLTYQWQSSLDGLTYTNIAATTATATVNQTAATYYQCIVTCSNGGAADTSTALLVPMSSFLNCYCSANLTTTSNTIDNITNVVITNSLGANLTQASTSVAPNYVSYNNTPLDLLRATSNTVAITMGTDGTQWSAAWVDWNQNGSFEASESIGLATAAAVASATVTYTFAVPANAVLGNTRIRVRGGSDAAYTTAGACANTAFGETEDYIVNIICPTIAAPVVTGASICSGNTATVSATPSLVGSTLTWFDAASAGTNLGTGASYTSPVLTATTPYWVEESIPGCAASPRSQATATVIPVNAVLTPVDVTCNGGSNGSFTLGAITCGALPFDYSVNGGAFGAIPTNLVAGTYSVVIRDAGLQQSAPISVVIAQPTWTINNPVASNISTCQGSASAILTANATLNPLATGTQTLTFGLSAQPTEVSGGSAFPAIATTPNIISSATLAALPAGAVVTGVTFSFPNLTPTGGSWANDMGFGFTGAVSAAYTAGIGAPGATLNFNYNSTLAIGSVNVAGGTINLNYYDLYADNAGSECTFPTGASVATMTINYTYPTQASVSWWDAASSGTQLGIGNTLETVGTSVLANTTTPGTYNFYAQGNNLGCTSAARTLVTVTVRPTSTGSQNLTVCAGGSVTVGTNTYNASGVFTDVLLAANGCDSTVTTNLTVSPAITGSQTLTVCAGGSVTVGTNTYTTSGVYTDVLTAANSCDSTVTTNLTVSPAITGSQTLTVCAGGSVTVGTNTYTASGTYNDLYIGGAANGCDSTYVTNLTVLGALDLTTSIVGNVITATSTTATYQWIDCDNANAIIAGETAQSYTATASGNYAVIITEAGTCSDTSACVNVVITSITSNSAQVVSIYPNPSNGLFTLNINNAVSNQVVISILDLQGKVVYSESDKNVSAQYNKQINLTDLAKGIYYVKLNIGSEVQIQKLIVQ